MTDLSAIAALESRVSVLMARNAELEREVESLREQRDDLLDDVDALRKSPTLTPPALEAP